MEMATVLGATTPPITLIFHNKETNSIIREEIPKKSEILFKIDSMEISSGTFIFERDPGSLLNDNLLIFWYEGKQYSLVYPSSLFSRGILLYCKIGFVFNPGRIFSPFISEMWMKVSRLFGEENINFDVEVGRKFGFQFSKFHFSFGKIKIEVDIGRENPNLKFCGELCKRIDITFEDRMKYLSENFEKDILSFLVGNERFSIDTSIIRGGSLLRFVGRIIK